MPVVNNDMAGGTHSQVFTQIKPMPILRTSGAPTFDGKYVNDFLSIIECHDSAAGLPLSELPKYIVQYCTDEVKQVIRFCKELSGSDWDKVKELLLELYGSNNEPVKATLKSLRSYIRKHTQGREFLTQDEVDIYHRGFLAIAAQLKSKKLINNIEMRLKFFAGLPKRTQAFVTTCLPAENLITTLPLAVKAVIDIICCRFNPTSIESYNIDSEEEDSNGDVVMGPATMTSTIQLSSIIKPAKPKTAVVKNDIDTLAQQLQQLSLNQAQMQQLFQSAMSTGNFNCAANATPVGKKTCFICGQAGIHRLHPCYCPETVKLITEALIKYDVTLNRYMLMNGADLLQIPFTPGGVVQYMQDHRADFPHKEGAPHFMMASASPTTLMLGVYPALHGDVYAIAVDQDECYYYDSAPARTHLHIWTLLVA
ncbi:hypothetical protein CVT25_012025 [Psilocybe cyanescens]|uniref:DUF4100 domain-containing protein n=1 Tax=Psilocybe cyanescens TaxID=93625 RepID=A0A409XH43_PSICY|nr:hypothetical protein CVT25_012025 [Psilocybe cyanescens]